VHLLTVFPQFNQTCLHVSVTHRWISKQEPTQVQKTQKSVENVEKLEAGKEEDKKGNDPIEIVAHEGNDIHGAIKPTEGCHDNFARQGTLHPDPFFHPAFKAQGEEIIRQRRG